VKRAARRLLAAACAALAAALAASAEAADPLNTMRAFLQADGHGARVDPRSWPVVADLVTWPLEPAWDHVYLIRGFELGTPERRDAELDVVVQYTITAEVRSNTVKEEERVESRTYRLMRDEDGVWRIKPPAPPPYVFASDADAQALAELLAPGDPRYVSNSGFVSYLLRDAGWAIPYADTAALATAAEFSSERTAEVGDLVLYFDGETPYHVGVVESEDTVVSSTLNGGIRRTPFGAFAGEIKYRRPLATARATPTAEPEPTPAKRRRRR
jgi:hypothetical protein